MSNLLIRNLEPKLMQALKLRAVQHGRSIEAEHHEILRQILLKTNKRSFAQVLQEVPNVGQDCDFERIHESEPRNVFD